MKITREIIDNGQKIVHVNYTKEELKKFRDQNDKALIEIAEMHRKRHEEEMKKMSEEDDVTPPSSSEETPAE